jgi:hypothetical protein
MIESPKPFRLEPLFTKDPAWLPKKEGYLHSLPFCGRFDNQATSSVTCISPRYW